MKINTQFDLTSEIPEPALKEFQAEFLIDRSQEAELLASLIAEGKYLEAQKILHKWKGICKPYGFGHLGEIAELNYENVGKKTEGDIEMLENINQYLEEKKIFLKSH